MSIKVNIYLPDGDCLFAINNSHNLEIRINVLFISETKLHKCQKWQPSSIPFMVLSLPLSIIFKHGVFNVIYPYLLRPILVLGNFIS